MSQILVFPLLLSFSSTGNSTVFFFCNNYHSDILCFNVAKNAKISIEIIDIYSDESHLANHLLWSMHLESKGLDYRDRMIGVKGQEFRLLFYLSQQNNSLRTLISICQRYDINDILWTSLHSSTAYQNAARKIQIFLYIVFSHHTFILCSLFLKNMQLISHIYNVYIVSIILSRYECM